MRTWHRVDFVSKCGSCGATIPEGALMQRIAFEGRKRHLVRCVGCADAKAPTDVPTLPADLQRGGLTKPMQPLAAVAKQAVREYLPYKDGA